MDIENITDEQVMELLNVMTGTALSEDPITSVMEQIMEDTPDMMKALEDVDDLEVELMHLGMFNSIDQSKFRSALPSVMMIGLYQRELMIRQMVNQLKDTINIWHFYNTETDNSDFVERFEVDFRTKAIGRLKELESD